MAELVTILSHLLSNIPTRLVKAGVKLLSNIPTRLVKAGVNLTEQVT